jgi:hypothetical protein
MRATGARSAVEIALARSCFPDQSITGILFTNGQACDTPQTPRRFTEAAELPMNRFDTLTADLPSYPTREFKTRHLGRDPIEYTLTPKGRIRRNGTGELVPYEGPLQLLGRSTKDTGLRLWRYRLTFHQGHLRVMEPLLSRIDLTLRRDEACGRPFNGLMSCYKRANWSSRTPHERVLSTTAQTPAGLSDLTFRKKGGAVFSEGQCSPWPTILVLHPGRSFP